MKPSRVLFLVNRNGICNFSALCLFKFPSSHPAGTLRSTPDKDGAHLIIYLIRP